MLRHIVALRFRPDVPDRERHAIYASLAGLRTRIDGIVDFQVRRNVSVEEELVRGFEDVFWFDFRDASVRDAYLADDVHRAIGARILAATIGGPDGVFVCDVEV